MAAQNSSGNDGSPMRFTMVHSSTNDLTRTEKEILDLVVGLYLSVDDIAKKRNTSKRAVFKIVRKLRLKGWLDKYCFSTKNDGSLNAMPVSINPENPSTTISTGERYYRLHNLHFVIEPFYFFPRYEKSEKSFGIHFGKWTLTLNKKNIEMQLQEKESFDSKDIDETRRLAQEDLNKMLLRAGDKYGFEVFKQGRCSVKLVNQHLAEVYNGIAKKVDGQYIRIEDKDGKVWLVIDKSLKVPEQETVSPLLAIDDGKMLGRYYNDWRENRPPTNSELLQYLATVAKNQDVYNENIKLHLTAVKDISSGVNRFGDVVDSNLKGLRQAIIHEIKVEIKKEMRKEVMRFLSKPSGPQPSSQLSLLQFGGA